MGFQILGFQTLKLKSHDEKVPLGGAVTTGQSSVSPRQVDRKGTKEDTYSLYVYIVCIFICIYCIYVYIHNILMNIHLSGTCLPPPDGFTTRSQRVRGPHDVAQPEGSRKIPGRASRLLSR